MLAVLKTTPAVLMNRYHWCSVESRSYKGVYAPMKLFDSELKVMDVLWTNGDMPARQIAAILTESIG